MKGFNEKCDTVLCCLKKHGRLNWSKFTDETKIYKDDAILSFLKEQKDYIGYNDTWINITENGINFIETTSFVAQRKVPY